MSGKSRSSQRFHQRCVHAIEFGPPFVERRRADAVLAAQLLDRQTRIGLVQKSDDLLFLESLLHVQTPSRGKNLNRTATQERGGRRYRSCISPVDTQHPR